MKILFSGLGLSEKYWDHKINGKDNSKSFKNVSKNFLWNFDILTQKSFLEIADIR